MAVPIIVNSPDRPVEVVVQSDHGTLHTLSLVVPSVVAVLTGIGLIIAFRSLKTSRLALLSNVRPVPLVDPVVTAPTHGTAMIEVQNVGPGVALNVYAECAQVTDWPDRNGGWTLARGMGFGRASGVVSIPSGKSRKIMLSVPDERQTLQDPNKLEVILQFTDASGNPYWSRQFSGIGGQHYPDVIHRGPVWRKYRELIPAVHPDSENPPPPPFKPTLLERIRRQT